MTHPVFVIDEYITSKLTAFCWWSEVVLDKDNVWWAKITVAILFPFFGSTVLIITEGSKNGQFVGFLGYFLGAFLFSWFLTVFCNYFPVTKSVLSNARRSPNKNRSLLILFVIKISVAVSLCITLVPPSIPFFKENEGVDVFGLVAYTLFLLCIYFVCTEPMPPNFKEHKKAEKTGLQYIPQKN